MITAHWYFDVVSPFSYFQIKQFSAFPAEVRVVPRPVLLAGLLGHWGQLGPAEIPPKRLHTYRFSQWFAQSRSIPFRMPPRHPFNPLAILRLLAAKERGISEIEAAFDVIYGEGRDGEDPETLGQIARLLDPELTGDAVVAAQACATAPEAKAKLRRNTDEAISRGVFGVPTLHVRDEIFWGDDATGMLLAYIQDPNLFASPEMQRLATLPSTVCRASTPAKSEAGS